MSEDPKRFFGIRPSMWIFCGVAIIMIIFGVYLLYAVDSVIDYDILNEQFATNQTFVDSLDCEKIILSINALEPLFSPMQQDEVKQLLQNFRQVKLEKEC